MIKFEIRWSNKYQKNLTKLTFFSPLLKYAKTRNDSIRNNQYSIWMKDKKPFTIDENTLEFSLRLKTMDENSRRKFWIVVWLCNRIYIIYLKNLMFGWIFRCVQIKSYIFINLD